MENIFKQLRTSRNLSMRGLANEIKVGHSHICELEKGKEPSVSELKKYHNYFKVPYEVLLGEKEYSEQGNNSEGICTLETLLNEYKNSVVPYERELYETIEFLLRTNQGLAIMTLLTKKEKTDIDKVVKLYSYLLLHDTENLTLSELILLASRI